ncbi:MAG TPA: hypothetical protein VFG35_13555 [Actinoplanes sp.]|nr:hypothetical protein [Actinoplanes sp.]
MGDGPVVFVTPVGVVTTDHWSSTFQVAGQRIPPDFPLKDRRTGFLANKDVSPTGT